MNNLKKIGATILWFWVAYIAHIILIIISGYLTSIVLRYSFWEGLTFAPKLYLNIFLNSLIASIVFGLLFYYLFTFIYKVLKGVPFFRNQDWSNLFKFVFNIGLLRFIISILIAFLTVSETGYASLLIMAILGLVTVYIQAKVLNYGLGKFYNPTLEKLNLEYKSKNN